MKIPLFELERYYAKYEFSGKSLLSASDCDGLSQSEVLSWADSETEKLWNTLQLGYTESNGMPLLRQEVAKLYKGVSDDEVLIVGPGEGIFITMNSLLDKGDHVICMWPGYQSLSQVATSIGCEVEKWQTSEKDNWKFDVDLLEAKIKPNTKCIIVNFPHNPTGYLPSGNDFQRIIEIAGKHNLYIFSDEMYRFLEFDPEDRLPSACEIYDKAISLFGMSKTFGMAGVRIGWLVIKDKELYDKVSAFKDYTTLCSSAPSEILSIIGLRSKEKIIRRHVTRIKKNLSLLDDFFERQSHLFSWVRPKAGTICFPKILPDENSFTFCERVIHDAGIVLAPSAAFGYDEKHFRIGFGRENMPEVLSEFEKYINKVEFKHERVLESIQ